MDVIQPLAAVILVMALLSGALLLLKKRGAAAFHLPGNAGSASRRLELLERISLGSQHTLHLVRVGDRLLLIATAPTSCQVLDHVISNGEKP
jgi:flagellar biogenesis protein FliO